MQSWNDIWREVWRFGGPGATYGSQLRLLPGGRIGGYDHPNERWWSIDKQRIRFHDQRWGTTSTFEPAGPDGIRHGTHMKDFVLELQRVKPIHLHATGAVAIDAVTRGHPRGRPHLVIVRAGPNSRHADWTNDLPDEDRSWDLCISTYGSSPRRGNQTADLEVEQNEHGKFQSLWRLLHAESPLWRYDYIMLCDDDIMLDRKALNLMFARVREHDLLVAQPSLSREGHVLHEVTAHHPDCSLRFTTFVESMVPVFRSWVLALAVPAFQDAKIGYGLDHLWSFLIGRPKGRLGIVDDVQVVHTKPHQGAYDVREAMAEEDRLRGLYGFAPTYERVGHIQK